MMNEIISQLTHDNNLFEEQWSQTFDRLENASLPNDSQSILNALVDYILTEPIEPSPCDVKYFFITMIIDQLIKSEISFEINNLINIFIRILNSSRNDQWHLHFLETIYQKFQIGERLYSHSLTNNFIEQILQSLQTKTFEENDEKWKHFLTEHLFSNSIDNENRLNQSNMKTNFQEFYKYALQQSSKSSIWSQIALILNETLFYDEINDTKSVIIHIEQLIIENKYNDARQLLSNLDLSSIDLEHFFHIIIQFCSIVEYPDLFCSNFLILFISKLEYLSIEKKFSSIFFDLILSILKLRILDAPNLSYRLLRKNDFYQWNDFIDLIKICISYDIIIDEEYFSKLNDLENIINFIFEKKQIYLKISQIIQPIIIDAILRWSNCQFHRGNYVYRMGISLLNLINLEQISEDICLKFIDILQNYIDADNKEIKQKKRLFFSEISKYLANFIEQLKRLSHDIHCKLEKLFLSILDHSLYDEDQNMTFEHVLLAIILLKTATSLSNENDFCLYQIFLNRMYYDAKNENRTILYQWWSGFWIITGFKFQNIARDHIEQFLDYTLNRKDMNLVSLLLSLTIQRLEILFDHFDALVETLLINNGEYLSSLTSLFTLIVQQHPEIVLSKHIQQIFSSMEMIPFNNYLGLIIQSLSSVANYQPNLFDNYREKLINLIIKNQNLEIFECFKKYLISSMIIHQNENEINNYLNILLNILKTTKCSNDIQKMIFYTCLLIGLKYKQILIQRREDFLKLNSNLLINYIDDTINNKIDESIIQQAQQEIELIKQKINNIKKEPASINFEIILSFHSSEQILVTKLKNHLKDIGYLCQMYDEQQTDINSIDTYIYGAKIIICCINTFYCQSDDCIKQFQLILKMKKPFIMLYMNESQIWPPEGILQSILYEYMYIPFFEDKQTNEWSENKFIELLSHIRYYVVPDPDLISQQYRHWFVPRLDTLIFLKSSTKEKNNYSSLLHNIPLVVCHPQIILSYQWDYQKDMISLYKQLTQLGYRIWLDIFQMNSGDSLLEKYNNTIRQSLCVLACITPKYLKVIQCQHEFSLAKDLNKPIICLLLEEMNSWPVNNGIELSVFTGKSYIDFRDSNSNNRWIGKSFEILLAQLRKIIPNVHTDKPRHLLEMQRPISASQNNNTDSNLNQQSKRRSSAPIIPKSRACSLM